MTELVPLTAFYPAESTTRTTTATTATPTTARLHRAEAQEAPPHRSAGAPEAEVGDGTATGVFRPTAVSGGGGGEVVEQVAEGVGVDRLDQVVVEAGLAGAAAVVLLALAGQGDERRAGRGPGRPRSRRATS